VRRGSEWAKSLGYGIRAGEGEAAHDYMPGQYRARVEFAHELIAFGSVESTYNSGQWNPRWNKIIQFRPMCGL
jgi:hypothetical protein